MTTGIRIEVLRRLCRQCREGTSHERCGGPAISEAAKQALMRAQRGGRPTERSGQR
jgi:hypothetical protein